MSNAQGKPLVIACAMALAIAVPSLGADVRSAPGPQDRWNRFTADVTIRRSVRCRPVAEAPASHTPPTTYRWERVQSGGTLEDDDGGEGERASGVCDADGGAAGGRAGRRPHRRRRWRRGAAVLCGEREAVAAADDRRSEQDGRRRRGVCEGGRVACRPKRRSHGRRAASHRGATGSMRCCRRSTSAARGPSGCSAASGCRGAPGGGTTVMSTAQATTPSRC